MKKWIIYCRISTSKQEQDWDSLTNQELACRRYCKNNWIVVLRVYKETFTWKEKSRPIFDEAINNSKENKVDYFIIFDIDRFSRQWYWVYSDLKEDLYKSNIELRDSKNIIQWNVIVMHNDIVEMWQYAWNIENTSEYAEVMISTQAKIEWKKIIQRTIPREIQLEQMWYKVRQANFWYLNEKVKINKWKATIQVKHPIEWEWIQEIFRKRAEWNLSDEEIVNDINLKWYKSKSNKALTVKQMQVYIKSPIYAWVISSKWTWYNPIKTPYQWLVDIVTWNKANRWKIIIIEDNPLRIEYSWNWKEITINQPIIKNRKSYNPDYCYSKVLKCPLCSWTLTASTSRWRSGKLHYYYVCKWKWKIKHINYSLKREETHEKIIRSFRSLKINNDILNLYEKVSKEVYEERKKELEEETIDYKKYLKNLIAKESEILDNIDKVINFPILLEAKNKELENIKLEKYKLELKSNEVENTTSIDKFIDYSKKVITHLDKLAIQRDRPDLINIAFEIVFNWQVEFDKISCHTPENTDFSFILSQ